MSPKFDNHLQNCVFLGHYYSDRHYDLYYRSGEPGTLIARFGSRPFEYHAADVESDTDHLHLIEAKRRATDIGMLDASAFNALQSEDNFIS